MFVRPIAANEWRLYRSLRLRALRESPDAFASTYEREAIRSYDDWEARIAAAATSPGAQAFFAFQHGEPCGLVWCKSSEAEPDVVEVFQMGVDPVSRGIGAGRALLASAIDWAESRGRGIPTPGILRADYRLQQGPPAPVDRFQTWRSANPGALRQPSGLHHLLRRLAPECTARGVRGPQRYQRLSVCD